MKFDLQSATKCDVETKTNTNDYNEELGIEKQFKVFFLTNLISFLIYFSFALYVMIKSSFKMDLKAWVNLTVNSASFCIKAIAWTYMISIYDKDKEAIIGAVVYEEMLWDSNGQLFLWDYFASFMIKMSIFGFIFEMMSIRVILQSESPEEKN